MHEDAAGPSACGWPRPPTQPATTNAAGDHQRAKLGALGLESAFDAVLISRELGVAKPHRAIFRRALGVRPDEAVHVGDQLNTDAEGARDAGLHGVWLDRSGCGALPPDAGISVIRRLAELPALLTRLVGRAAGAPTESPVEAGVRDRLTSLPGAGSGQGEGP